MSDIRKSKTLTIYASDAFRSSAVWGAKFLTDTVEIFNAMVAARDVDMKFVETTQAPPRDGEKGTNVQIDVSSGSHIYYQFGKNEGKLDPGSTLNAKTHSAAYAKGAAEALTAHASIFVHANPVITEAARPAGSGLKRYVVLHEMLHAAGLLDNDPGHKTGSKPDVFATFVGYKPGAEPEDTPGQPGDRIQLSKTLFMPKFFITSKTADLLRSVWK